MGERTHRRVSWGNLDQSNKERPDEYDSRLFAEGEELLVLANPKLRKNKSKPSHKDQYEFEKELFQRRKDPQDFVREKVNKCCSMECSLVVKHAQRGDLDVFKFRAPDDVETRWPLEHLSSTGEPLK